MQIVRIGLGNVHRSSMAAVWQQSQQPVGQSLRMRLAQGCTIRLAARRWWE